MRPCRLCLALLLALLPGTRVSAEQGVPIAESGFRQKDAATGFTVTVTVSGFTIDQTEVTQAEYQALTGTNPSFYRGASRPVESVTWFEAVRFANLRSQKEGLPSCYLLPSGALRQGCSGYRLPTAAEWSAAYAEAAGGAGQGDFRQGNHQETRSLLERAKAGTMPVESSAADRRGLRGMAGNVWEWCQDWYAAYPALDQVRDPMGPATGQAKVVRGGSVLTTASQWNKGLLSSMEPQARSRFTGFRLVRSGSAGEAAKPQSGAAEATAWLQQFQAGKPAQATRVLPRTADDSREVWRAALGQAPAPAQFVFRPLQSFRRATWNGTLADLALQAKGKAGTTSTVRILVAEPIRKPAGKLPVLLVPFYDADTPMGEPLGGRRGPDGGTRAFGQIAVQQGYLAVAIKWFGEHNGEGYDEAVFQHLQQYPGLTPLGRWIYELQSVVDYLLTRADVDEQRIAMMGHSLGGKMALYGAAFEPRIKATVASEPGISLQFSNYEDFWYLGEQRRKLPADADQDELLSLLAPRPFLLLAGESADGDKSWPFLQAAQARYPQPLHLGMVNHRSGHSPTEASVQQAFAWLRRMLATP